MDKKILTTSFLALGLISLASIAIPQAVNAENCDCCCYSNYGQYSFGCAQVDLDQCQAWCKGVANKHRNDPKFPEIHHIQGLCEGS